MSRQPAHDGELTEGQRFGKYTLVKRIASGGMADIYLARQAGAEGFEKNIAIKKIRAQHTENPDFMQMFLNEAKLAAQLSHPNICQIFDLGRIGDSFFIAMEYIAGRDMNRIINASNRVGIPFPMEYALKIASNACEGLYYAHSKTDNKGHALNVVHRDITPENIIVSFDGGVKLLDFGIAKAENLVQTDKPGEVKGKLSYMSPEQCQGKDTDHRSDIFSLGVVLYEWITGFRLFTGDNDEVIIRSIVEGKIYPPSYFKPEVPKPVETVLMKALEKDRARRYQSAWDMQYDIDNFLTQHEFTPSNVHLANFVKQLFREDIEVERKTLSKKIPLRPPPLPDDDGRRLSSDVKVRNTDATAESQMVAVKVAQDDLKALSAIAQKNRVTIQELMAEVIRMYLRYK